MSQVINAVGKNANFIIFYNYNTDTSTVSAPIHSIPVTDFGHELMKDVDNIHSTLFIYNQDKSVMTITAEDAAEFPIEMYVIVSGAEDGTLYNFTELLNFFLLP